MEKPGNYVYEFADMFGHGLCVKGNLQMLFNFVAQSDSVKDMSLL